MKMRLAQSSGGGTGHSTSQGTEKFAGVENVSCATAGTVPIDGAPCTILMSVIVCWVSGLTWHQHVVHHNLKLWPPAR